MNEIAHLRPERLSFHWRHSSFFEDTNTTISNLFNSFKDLEDLNVFTLRLYSNLQQNEDDISKIISNLSSWHRISISIRLEDFPPFDAKDVNPLKNRTVYWSSKRRFFTSGIFQDHEDALKWRVHLSRFFGVEKNDNWNIKYISAC